MKVKFIKPPGYGTWHAVKKGDVVEITDEVEAADVIKRGMAVAYEEVPPPVEENGKADKPNKPKEAK